MITSLLMTTLSVPLPADILEAIENLVKRGIAANKADLVRKALQKYIEDQAVKAIFDAAKEPSLEGDIDELAKLV